MSIKRVGDILLPSFKMVSIKAVKKRREAMALFETIAPEWEKNFVCLSYSRGRLTLGTTSSATLQEAVQFHCESWLSGMKEKGFPVKEIRINLIEEAEINR
jgi:hypothetical protein